METPQFLLRKIVVWLNKPSDLLPIHSHSGQETLQDLTFYMPRPFTFYNLPYHDYTIEHSRLLTELDVSYPTSAEYSVTLQIIILLKTRVLKKFHSNNLEVRRSKTICGFGIKIKFQNEEDQIVKVNLLF